VERLLQRRLKMEH